MSPVDQADFTRMMLQVVVLGVVAFGVSGALLFAFWKSLKHEDTKGELEFTGRSGALLAAVVLSLIFFCFVFVVLAYM